MKLLAEQDVPLVEDDVNGELAFAGTRPRAAKSWDEHDNVLYCSSVSKFLAPGFRIGWIANRRYQEQLRALQWASTSCANTAAQLAVAEFLQAGHLDRHLRALRSAVEQTMRRVEELIRESFPPDTCVTRPRGGLVLWLELPVHIDGLEVYRRALAANISVMPGIIFSSRATHQHHLRLNCAKRWTPRLATALRAVGAICRALA